MIVNKEVIFIDNKFILAFEFLRSKFIYIFQLASFIGTLKFCLYTQMCVLVTQLCSTPRNPMDFAHQAHMSMGFSRQEYWNTGISCHSLLQYTHIHMSINVVYIYIYVCTCLCVYMYMCLFVYISINFNGKKKIFSISNKQ